MNPTHPQLDAIAEEYESARSRLHRLSDEIADRLWSERPAPERWSVAECVAHLNLTSEAVLPALRDGLERARTLGEARRSRYRRGPMGWFLWRTMGPPVRFRVGTPAAFVPRADHTREELVSEFDRLQTEQLELLRTADGLPIDRVKVASPFSDRVRYNLYACFSIQPRHQHRHLWQAERSYEAVAGPERSAAGRGRVGE